MTSAVGTGPFKQAVAGHLRQRLRRRTAEAGAHRGADHGEAARARSRVAAGSRASCASWSTASTSKTGKVRWEQEAHKGPPIGGRHRKNTYASETPATDGERIYALFGNIGLFCFAMDGKPLWSHKIDPQPRYLDFGTAASPVVHEGRVYIQDDNEKSSFLAALDAKTGAVIWKTPRTGARPDPVRLVLAVRLGERRGAPRSSRIGPQLAVSYDLDGKELWRLKGADAGEPDAHRRGRPAVYRHRLAGGIQPSAVRDQAGRERRHLAGAGRDLERVRRVVPAARVRLHLVAAGLRRPRLRRQRHRRPAGVRGEDRQGTLQGARRRRRQHLLGVAVGLRRQGVLPQRGRGHLRHQAGRHLRGDREEQPRRDGARQSRGHARRAVHPHADASSTASASRGIGGRGSGSDFQISKFPDFRIRHATLVPPCAAPVTFLRCASIAVPSTPPTTVHTLWPIALGLLLLGRPASRSAGDLVARSRAPRLVRPLADRRHGGAVGDRRAP